jgi:hypothetical protein
LAERQFRSHLIDFIDDFIQQEGDQKQSVSQLSRAFEYRPIRIKAGLANGLEEPKVRDCHLALDGYSEREVLE